MPRAVLSMLSVKEPEGPKFKTVIVTRGWKSNPIRWWRRASDECRMGAGWGRRGDDGHGDANIRLWPAGPVAWRRSPRRSTLALLPALAGAQAQSGANVIQISSSKTTSIKIAKGKPKTIKTNVPFYEIVIGDPEIANVNPLTDSSFYVLGNNLGTTGIALFDENKQLVGSVDIEVTLDTDKLASTIRDTVPGSDIDVKSANGRLVLSGSAEDAVAADKATRIATEFSGEEKVINSVNISSSQQVQLNVRFVEVNRQVGQELGTQIAAAYVGPNGGIGFNSDPNILERDAGRRR